VDNYDRGPIEPPAGSFDCSLTEIARAAVVPDQHPGRQCGRRDRGDAAGSASLRFHGARNGWSRSFFPTNSPSPQIRQRHPSGQTVGAPSASRNSSAVPPWCHPRRNRHSPKQTALHRYRMQRREL